MTGIFDHECLHDTPCQAVEVEFSLPDAGWIRCRVKPLHEVYAISRTYIWGGFARLLEWLEQIAGGAQAATWRVDEEGRCSRLQFYGGDGSVDDRCDYLLHFQSRESIRRIRGVAVERRQLVESFYRAFRATVEDPRYDLREWEAHPQFYKLDEMEDEEYTVAHAFRPFGGEFLRELRSPRLEAWLSGETDRDKQLSLFPEPASRNRYM